MSGFNRYAAGAKVYRGGSSAAHSGGGLDPMGYIERSLNNQASQQRSGFAQAALARMGYGQGGSNGGMFGGMRRGISPKPAPKKKAAPKKAAPKKAAAPGSPAANSVDEIGNDSLGIQTPVIGTSTGQLTLDPTIMADAAQAEFQYGQNAAMLNQQESDINNQYQAGQRDLGYQQQNDQRGDLNRFSARGMAFSSGYGQEVADSTNLFNNAFSDLSNQYNSGLQGINGQRAANDQFVVAARQRQAQAQAALNAQNALSGQSLGLYQGSNNADGNASSVPQFAPVAPQAQAQQPSLSRAAFLKAHPILASLKGKDRERFLQNHPGIARAWARYN